MPGSSVLRRGAGMMKSSSSGSDSSSALEGVQMTETSARTVSGNVFLMSNWRTICSLNRCLKSGQRGS